MLGLPEASTHQHTDISENTAVFKLRFLQTFLELKRQQKEKHDLQVQVDFWRLHTLENFQKIFSKSATPTDLLTVETIKNVAQDKIDDETILSIERSFAVRATGTRQTDHPERRERLLRRINEDKDWQIDTEKYVKRYSIANTTTLKILSHIRLGSSKNKEKNKTTL